MWAHVCTRVYAAYECVGTCTRALSLAALCARRRVPLSTCVLARLCECTCACVCVSLSAHVCACARVQKPDGGDRGVGTGSSSARRHPRRWVSTRWTPPSPRASVGRAPPPREPRRAPQQTGQWPCSGAGPGGAPQNQGLPPLLAPGCRPSAGGGARDAAWRAGGPDAATQPSNRPGACVFQEFADSVSQLVTQKFRELTVGLASAHARHKALAGIVMTTGNASHSPGGIPPAATHTSCLPDLGDQAPVFPMRT